MTAKSQSRQRVRDRIKYLLRHPGHAFYHPHQRLWNLYTTPIAKRLLLRKPLILADSLLLWAEVLLQRARRKGVAGLTARAQAGASPVVIFDIGQHVDPRQIVAMVDWFGGRLPLRIYGFEAHPEYFEIAQGKLAQLDNVRLENLALVGPDHQDDHIRLYLAGGRGVGDSVYARRSEQYLDVPALRLSKYIADNGIDVRSSIVILRMNIEGAEYGVLQDLAEAGLLAHIDGFFGAWDDMYKTDPKDDERFRAFLRKHRVRSLPFNDRDLGSGAVFALRKAAIRYALSTAMLGQERQ
jgi:FkbM family methyltransferase